MVWVQYSYRKGMCIAQLQNGMSTIQLMLHNCMNTVHLHNGMGTSQLHNDMRTNPRDTTNYNIHVRGDQGQPEAG